MAEAKPSWIKTKAKDLEKSVIEISKETTSPAKIGLILRDKHGIPKSKLISKKITHILKESKTEFKEEKEHIQDRIEQIKKHFSKNKHDYSAQRALTKKLWALQKLAK